MNKKVLVIPALAISGVLGIAGVSVNNAQTESTDTQANNDTVEIAVIEDATTSIIDFVDVEEAVEPTQNEEVENTPSEPVEVVQNTPVVESTPEAQPEPPVSPELDTCSVSWHDNIGDRETMQNGEIFDANSLTGAHRSLPLGSIVTLNYEGKTVNVIITDRTSQSFGRCIDITSGAFTQLAPLSQGIIMVEIVVN